MGYQSKTYSLSDEVVEAIEAARAQGETPNRFLRRVLLTPPGDEDDFDRRRKETQSRIARGARRVPVHTLTRAKGDKRR